MNSPSGPWVAASEEQEGRQASKGLPISTSGELGLKAEGGAEGPSRRMLRWAGPMREMPPRPIDG